MKLLRPIRAPYRLLSSAEVAGYNNGAWMSTVLIGLFLGRVSPAAAQASYTGQFGGVRIELQVEKVELRRGLGVYFYSTVGTPILLNSNLHRGTLILTEYAADHLITKQNFSTTKYKPTATLTIRAFSFRAPVLHGTWRSLATQRQLPLTLTRATGPDEAGKATALPTALQLESTTAHYFKTLLTGKASDAETRVSAVQVIEKGTNRVLQQFPVNGRAIGQGSVSVEDYNFDGLLDFSIYEDDGKNPELASWGHNNTTSQYFLYDPTTRQFVPSGFRGVGLAFDARKKRVYAYTPSHTYGSLTKSEYRLVHNQLVLMARQCLTWHPYQGFTVSEPSACQ